MWDKFDIVAAHYYFCEHYHDGQFSKLYIRLCRITEGIIRFRPSPLWKGPDDVSSNCRDIYDALVTAHNEESEMDATMASEQRFENVTQHGFAIGTEQDDFPE